MNSDPTVKKKKKVHEQVFGARFDLPCFLLTWKEGTFPLTGLAVWSGKATFSIQRVPEVVFPTLKQNLRQMLCSFKSTLKNQASHLKRTTINTAEKQSRGLWLQNSIVWLSLQRYYGAQ
jgi:hypothetical protein